MSRRRRRPSATVRIAELKARLSAYLRRVQQGETITVLDRNTPIARLVPLETAVPLRVRPAARVLKDVPLPPPLGVEIDVVSLVRAERGDR